MDISEAVCAARAAALAKAVSGGTLKLRTGSKPAACAAGDVGECVATFQLPAVAAKGCSVVMVASPLRAISEYEGVVGHYRVYSGGAVVAQGSAGGSGAELDVGAALIKKGQLIEIQSWVVTDEPAGE